MKKSIGTSLLSAVLASTLVANAGAVAVTDFSDIKSADWYYSTVDYATKNNLMVGISDTLFAPNDNLTRAMAVVVLGRMAKVKVDDTKETAFTDVPAGHWSAGSVSWASEKKIVNGYGNGLFGRDDKITRQDAATIIGRYLTSINYKKPATTTTTTTPTTTTFSDADQIADYAKEAVKQCAELGLITGYPDGSFQPTKFITRAEYAAVSERLNKTVIAAATPTPGGGGGTGGGGGGGGGATTPTTQNVTRTKTTTYQASLKGVGAGNIDKTLLSQVYTLTQTRQGTTKNSTLTNGQYADFTATTEYGKAQGDATLGTLLVDIMSDGETQKLINNYYNGKDGNGNYLSNSALGKVLGYSLNTTVSGQKARIEITPEGVVSISVIANITQLNKTNDATLNAVTISIEEMNALAEKLNNGDALTLEEINTLYALSDQAKEVQTKDDTTLTDKIEEIKQDLPQNVQDMVGNLSGQEIKDKAQEYDNQLTNVKESIKDNLGIVQDKDGNLVKVDDPSKITTDENGKYVVPPEAGNSQTLIDSTGTVQITEAEKELIHQDLADKDKVNTKVEPIKVTLDLTSYFNTGSQLDTKYQDQAQRAKNSLLTQLSETSDGAVATAIDGLLKYGNPATNEFVKIQNKDVSIDVAYNYGNYAAEVMTAFKTLMDAVGTDGTDASVARQKVVADWVVNNADNLLLGITVNTDEISKLMASAGIFENKDTSTLTQVTIDLSAQKVLNYMLDLVKNILGEDISLPSAPTGYDGQHTFTLNVEQKTMEEKDALKK